MKNLDLFGGETEVNSSKNMSHYQKIKLKNKYRKSEGNEKCKNCSNHIHQTYHGKHYHKCKLIGCSASEATDIRIGYVCDEHVLMKKGSNT